MMVWKYIRVLYLTGIFSNDQPSAQPCVQYYYYFYYLIRNYSNSLFFSRFFFVFISNYKLIKNLKIKYQKNKIKIYQFSLAENLTFDDPRFFPQHAEWGLAFVCSF